MIFLWVAFYGAAYTAGRLLPGDWAVAGCMAGYCLLFLGWIVRREDCEKIGLGFVRGMALGRYPGTAALLLLPVCNILSWGGLPDCSGPDCVELLCAALVEELFFRGYLLTYLRKWGTIPGILAASGAFALLHGANLLSGAAWDYAAMQILTAFLTGVLYCMAALELKSILPGAAAHFLGNVTGTTGNLTYIWFLIPVSAIWCLWLGHNIWVKEKERL